MIFFDKIKQELEKNQYTWVITGVAGFIGSSLLDTLLTLNQKVVGIDNFSTGFRKNIDDVINKHSQNQKDLFTFYEGDIRDYNFCFNSFQNTDFLLHQAALGSVPRSIETPEITNDVNVNGFLSVLRAARDTKIKSIIYASSSSVYGDSPLSPKQEHIIGSPLSPYAVSKLTNELYAEVFSKCYNLNLIGLRYFNVFGPRQNPKGPYAAVMPIWIQSILKEEPLFINGDGETSRDFTFIENIIQANILAALYKNKTEKHQVFNIAAGNQTTLKQLLSLISHNFLSHIIKVTHRDFRPGDVRHSLADIKKATSVLEYCPTHTLQEGIKLTCQWYKRNQ